MKLRGLAASLAVLAAITVGASGCSEAGASNEENPETAVTVEDCRRRPAGASSRSASAPSNGSASAPSRSVR